MKFSQSQSGMSILSWLIGLALVAFVASTAFKMMPHYFDYMSLDKTITSIESVNVTTVREFYSHVSKGMQVNGIRDINLEDVLKVEVANNEFRAMLDYEKREPMIQNLDLVARFQKEYRLRMP
ncbi:DUF4845 domain-containing protein [Stutzerimonas tarimensis]|uniref:DUF4845 domain-containing protein n=1 Tax=Stutzerimonas tarimensis TaxID=1507735 RepID=A0ABV7T8A1_9GAMM